MYGTGPFVRPLHGARCIRRHCSSSSGEANDRGRGDHDPDGICLAFRGGRQPALRTIDTSLRETHMTIFLIILVTILLLVLFVGVTVAGGRSHDRQNERRDDDR